jgi:hypothetical protein
MADIYQCATLTLAATASSGASQGCYNHTFTTIRDVEIKLPGHLDSCRIAVRKPMKHWNNLTPSQRTEEFPLLLGGWVFQERLLSPRVLHFCGSELVWECRQVSACECGDFDQDSSPGATYYKAMEDIVPEDVQFTATHHVKEDWNSAMLLLLPWSPHLDNRFQLIPNPLNFEGLSEGVRISQAPVAPPSTYATIVFLVKHTLTAILLICIC